jgi:hypothetical protein
VAHDRPRQSEAARLVRPDHFEHGFRRHLEIVAAAPSARDRARERGVVDAIPDEGFIDMDGNDLADVALLTVPPAKGMKLFVETNLLRSPVYSELHRGSLTRAASAGCRAGMVRGSSRPPRYATISYPKLRSSTILDP